DSATDHDHGEDYPSRCSTLVADLHAPVLLPALVVVLATLVVGLDRVALALAADAQREVVPLVLDDVRHGSRALLRERAVGRVGTDGVGVPDDRDLRVVRYVRDRLD